MQQQNPARRHLGAGSNAQELEVEVEVEVEVEPEPEPHPSVHRLCVPQSKHTLYPLENAAVHSLLGRRRRWRKDTEE